MHSGQQQIGDFKSGESSSV